MIVTSPNCTIPDRIPAFVSDSNTRGTLDILFNSFGILILCTWSVLRLNVPLQTTPRTRIQRLRKDFEATFIKLRWMAITLLAPEYIFGRAVANLRSCLFHTPLLEDMAYQDGVPWSRFHTCLADMGGFVLVFPTQAKDEERIAVVDGCERNDVVVEGSSGKAPSLPHVAIVPLSPIDLGTIPQATPGHHGTMSRSPSPHPDCGQSDSSGSFDHASSIDLESGRVASPELRTLAQPPHSSSDSSSSFSLTTEPTIASTTATNSTPGEGEEMMTTALGNGDVDKTAYHGKSTSRAFISGKDWGEALIRRTRLRYIERKARHYGPIVWQSHPEMMAMSKRLIASLTTHHPHPDNDKTSSFRPNLPPGMNKHQLIRALITFEGSNSPLCAAQLLEARRLGLIQQLPYITTSMVCDRDKGDTLVKLAAVWQTVWLAIDLVVRQLSNLPSSPLEIMVVAFAALALLIYLINWFQPKDVQTPFYLYATRLPTMEELHSLAIHTPKAHGLWPGVFGNKHIPSVNAREGYYQSTRVWGTGMVWSGMVFGSLHLVAWNSSFPSPLERWMWRGAALVTTAWPSIPGVLGWVVDMLQRYLSGRKADGADGDGGGRRGDGRFQKRGFERKTIRRFWQAVALPILIVPLFCARVFVLMEAYRSLYYLPPESYVTTWTSNVPRFT